MHLGKQAIRYMRASARDSATIQYNLDVWLVVCYLAIRLATYTPLAQHDPLQSIKCYQNQSCSGREVV